MARSHRPERQPAIEVLDTGSDEAGLRKVTVARGRADDGEGDGGRRPGRRRGALGVAAVVAVLLVAMVVSGTGRDGSDEGDDDAAPALTEVPSSRPTTTTTRPRRSPTTTAAVRSGPIVPGAAGMGLLVLERQRVEVVDLSTGERRPLDVALGEIWNLPVAVGTTVVMPDSRGPTLAVDLVTGGHAELPPADQVYATSDGDVVWLVRWGQSAGAAGAVLADLEGRTIAGPIDVPMDNVVGADRAGLVTTVFDATYLLTPDGGVRFLATGVAVGVGGGLAAVVSCADGGRCGLDLVDLTTGERTRMPAGAFPLDAGRDSGWTQVRIGPDRQVAVSITNHRTSMASLTVVGRDGRVLAREGAAGDTHTMAILPDWSGALIRDPVSWDRIRWLPFDGSSASPIELDGRFETEWMVPVRVSPVAGA